ncbi:hypothetical protein CIPAW_03G172200 [Carya illinoinensis]|uniref:Uncharacterized protein n=1 Tax=Carya illinoinensis TaxID=32201 RepID=A0A8T1R3Q7_CARIL|nr:hypothetical protein CIPAW_03G172200 [Carya illinoinensis]
MVYLALWSTSIISNTYFKSTTSPTNKWLATKSSLVKASSSGNFDAWFPTSQTPPKMRKPTRGIGSTPKFHRRLDCQGSRSLGLEAGHPKAISIASTLPPTTRSI